MKQSWTFIILLFISNQLAAMQTPEKKVKRSLLEEEGYGTQPETPSPVKSKSKRQHTIEGLTISFIVNQTNVGAQIVYSGANGINYKILPAYRLGQKSIFNEEIPFSSKDFISISLQNKIFRISANNSLTSIEVALYDPLHDRYGNVKTFAVSGEMISIKIKETSTGPLKGDPYIEIHS